MSLLHSIWEEKRERERAFSWLRRESVQDVEKEGSLKFESKRQTDNGKPKIRSGSVLTSISPDSIKAHSHSRIERTYGINRDSVTPDNTTIKCYSAPSSVNLVCVRAKLLYRTYNGNKFFFPSMISHNYYRWTVFSISLSPTLSLTRLRTHFRCFCALTSIRIWKHDTRTELNRNQNTRTWYRDDHHWMVIKWLHMKIEYSLSWIHNSL